MTWGGVMVFMMWGASTSVKAPLMLRGAGSFRRDIGCHQDLFQGHHSLFQEDNTKAHSACVPPAWRHSNRYSVPD